MRLIRDLELGFSDAENYRRRENKDLFNKIFIRNDYLARLCLPSISFLIGEKGTGKTAYAVFMSNNDYNNNLSSIRYIRETEYQTFVALKRERHLQLSDYASIWRVIIYLLISQQVKDREGGATFLQRFGQFNGVQKAIDEYYNSAFSPEIIQALKFVQESRITAELMAKYANVGGEAKDQTSFTEARFQTNLLYIRHQFERALSQVRLEHNHLIFIDGIDIRPSSIPYAEYLECIKGLATAVWEINNDFFPGIRGGGGRMRAVLLIRPDIFESLGMQNQNTKARDNAVFLDWRTEYANQRTCNLFQVTDHLLASQQPGGDPPMGQTWDHYFPWDATNVAMSSDQRTSFVAFLRWSYYRPRDIVTMLQMLKDIAVERGTPTSFFSMDDFEAPEFRRRYADYLLGELKDHLTFYYGTREYELFLKFFEFLNGKHKFSYEEFLDAFEVFSRSANRDAEVPQFMAAAPRFLQFLYDLNVICYIERPVDDRQYVRWCFRERSYGNISPKVKEGIQYQVFYGLAKALNVGQEFEKKRKGTGNKPRRRGRGRNRRGSGSPRTP